MKHKILAFIGFTFSFFIIAMGFQNCAEQLPVLNGTLEATSLDAASSEESMETAPTDAKQTLESMMSLLNLAPADINMSEVNSEINYRRNLLVPQNDMALLNAPSMIAITSLAAVVCKQAVAKDKRITTKEIFLDLDFSKGPKAYGKVGALKSYESLALLLWGRKATPEESTYFSDVVEEYFKTLDAAALDKATETDKLAIFICTGMLSVPDSYLL